MSKPFYVTIPPLCGKQEATVINAIAQNAFAGNDIIIRSPETGKEVILKPTKNTNIKWCSTCMHSFLRHFGTSGQDCMCELDGSNKKLFDTCNNWREEK